MGTECSCERQRIFKAYSRIGMSASAVTTLRVLGLWLHLLAVVVWVGGKVGWMLVLFTEKVWNGEKGGAAWLERLGRRICTVGWEALFVIVLTGIFNLLPRGQSGRLFDSAYLTPLLIKLSLVGGMVGLQLWQHGWLVPTLGNASSGSGAVRETRQLMLVASGGLVALAAGALWIGLSLRF